MVCCGKSPGIDILFGQKGKRKTPDFVCQAVEDEKDVVLKMMAKAFWKDTCPILACFGSQRW